MGGSGKVTYVDGDELARVGRRVALDETEVTADIVRGRRESENDLVRLRSCLDNDVAGGAGHGKQAVGEVSACGGSDRLGVHPPKRRHDWE